MQRYRITELGYKFDKLIFFGVFAIVVSAVISIMYLNNFDFSTHPYFECHRQTCKNPYYNMQCKQSLNILWVIPLYQTQDCKIGCDWCNSELLPIGTYGERPKAGFLMDHLVQFSFLLMLLGILINHFVHNRGKKFDIEIPVTKKIVINRRTLKEYFKNEASKDNSSK